jgi:Flp pilus assembly protein TadG
MRSQTGNALVEFALVLPVVLLVTFGIIGVGRYAYFGMVVANAARAGAQYGAQPGNGASADTAGMINAAEADAANNGVATVTSPAPSATSFCMYWDWSTPNPASNPTPDPGCSPSTGTKQALVYVQVTVTGTAKSGFNVPFLPSQVTITQTATQRVTQ